MTLDLPWVADLIWTQFWQMTVVILLIAGLTRLICRDRPHLAHLLWLVVFVKCWIPPVWSSPTGVFSWGLRSQTPTVERSAPVHRELVATRVSPNGARAADAATDNASFAASSPSLPDSMSYGASSAVAPESHLGRFMLGTWLGGAAFVAATAALRGLLWKQSLRASTRALPPEVESLVAELAAILRVCRVPRTVVTSLRVGPAVYGLWRPTLVLPEFMIAGGSRDRLAAVLAHELIHVRRGDLPLGLFQLATQAVWWFHPLVWWAGRELTRERERSCDEEVLAGLRCEPAGYAQSLLDVLKVRRRGYALPAWVGMRPADITRRRLEHIMSRGASARARTPRRYAMAAGALLLLLGPGAAPQFQAIRTVADEPPQPPADERASPPPRDEAAPKASNADDDQKSADEKPAADDEASSQHRQTRRAIDRGVAYLKTQQHDDGSWTDPAGYPGGITAICSLALLESGVDSADDALQRSLSRLRDIQPQTTYVASLAAMVFCKAAPDHDQRHILRIVEWLAEHQKQQGPMTGAWGYPQADGDNSNTGFAIMALYEADRVGIHADQKVWRRALKYWTSTQQSNGSWGYKPNTPGTGSMTCQGLACVAAACEVLDERQPDRPGPLAIQRASQWLGRDFSVKSNPGFSGPRPTWLLYYLHALRRAGKLSHQQRFGDHDWYAEGAKALIESQAVPGGYWKSEGHAEDNPHVATSLALLFLAHEK